MAIQAPKFNKEAPRIHEEILELEKRLAEKKRELEEGKEAKHEKEIIKEIIKEKVELSQAPTVKPIAPLPHVVKKTKEIKAAPEEKRIKLLTDLAFEKGVIHATEVAKGLDDAYVLDEFHDTLVDELYNYLVEKGKLKQI